MEKLVYLLTHEAAASGADLRSALIDKVTPTLRANGATQVSVNVNDEHVAQGDGVAIRRSDPPIRAMVCFWLQNCDDREECEQALSLEAEGLTGYLVAESRPLLHEPPIGERAPGANLVTCIKRKPDISLDEFFERWTVEHRQVAVETQSTFAYVRNTVVRALRPGPAWDGIVEESFPIEALVDPHVWYDCNDAEEYKRRLARMIESVNAFLDLSVLESTPMSEYYLG